MKTLSRLIALSLSVMASTAAFAQAPSVGGSSTTSPTGVKVNVAGSKISSNLSTLPSKNLAPMTAPAENRPFMKFDENHPVLAQFAQNHPSFADRVFENREQLHDRGMTVQQAKDRFQKRVERNKTHAAKVQELKAVRQQELARHAMANRAMIASHRANLMRAHK